MTLAIPHTMIEGTKAKASQVNANFQAIEDTINANITAIATNASDIDALETGKQNALNASLSKTADYTMLNNDWVEADSTSGACIFTLPATGDKARVSWVAGTNSVTVTDGDSFTYVFVVLTESEDFEKNASGVWRLV